MSLFQQHTEITAPSDAAHVLARIKERYGFIPNLAAYLSESPVVLGAVLGLMESFDKTTLTPQEQQVVLLTVSALNGCNYCRTVHTALARRVELDAATLNAVIAFEPLADAKLDALRDFTKRVVEERGWVSEEPVSRFLNAGFSKAQVFEVVMGIAIKTLTNYSNHLAGAVPNPEFIAMAVGEAAA